jgi:hypothetical protein
VIFGFWFSTIPNEVKVDISLQLCPYLWHLDALCQRTYDRTKGKGGSFALSGKGVEVHVFSTGIFEHQALKTRVTQLYGGTDTVGQGTEIACVIGGQELGIARECKFFSYAFTTDEEFLEAVDAFLTYKEIVVLKPTVVFIDMDNTPSAENNDVLVVGNPVELAITKITDLGYIVIVPAGDGYTNQGSFVGSLNAFVNTPSRMENVFAIGAYDYKRCPAPFSNYGKAVDAIAPGCDILTGTIDTVNFSDFKRTSVSSTRVSAACVAGIAVGFLQQNPMATRKDFKSFIAKQFFNSGLYTYIEYYLKYDPAFTPDRQNNYVYLNYNKLEPFFYRFPIVKDYHLAYNPYTKSKIIVNTLDLGSIQASTYFELLIEATSINSYNEEKLLFFKLDSVIPDWLSLEIGESTGKVFGMSKNISQDLTCSFNVRIEDGLYAIIKTFNILVLANQKKNLGIGAILKTTTTSSFNLNLDTLLTRQTTLNISENANQNISVQRPLQRKVYLLDKVSGSFVAKTHTDQIGEFSFYVPNGTYQALAIDENSVYNAVVLSNFGA